MGWLVIGGIASAMAIVLIVSSRYHHPLFPADGSQFPYSITQSSDVLDGGKSRISVHPSTEVLDVSYQLIEGYQYPYASVGLNFGEQLADWSAYRTLEISIACTPANVLMFTLNSYDAQITQPDDFLSYRPATTSFSCTPTAQIVVLDLDHLTTPKWWLERTGLPLSSVAYDLTKVFGISIENTSQSPRQIESKVLIRKVVLVGRDWLRVAAALAILLILVVLGVVYWLQRHTQNLRRELAERATNEQPEEDYQPVAKASKIDRDRHAVLTYMKTQYANPELSLELLTSSLGINRVKVNDILKEQEGLTFSTYLNKLRLTEAARLLREKDARVAEIGFMVGYNNASYFNRTFKKEYGCTPNAYKKHMLHSAQSETPSN